MISGLCARPPPESSAHRPSVYPRAVHVEAGAECSSEMSFMARMAISCGVFAESLPVREMTDWLRAACRRRKLRSGSQLHGGKILLGAFPPSAEKEFLQFRRHLGSWVSQRSPGSRCWGGTDWWNFTDLAGDRCVLAVRIP